jgi:hypothetical protein
MTRNIQVSPFRSALDAERDSAFDQEEYRLNFNNDEPLKDTCFGDHQAARAPIVAVTAIADRQIGLSPGDSQEFRTGTNQFRPDVRSGEANRQALSG